MKSDGKPIEGRFVNTVQNAPSLQQGLLVASETVGKGGVRTILYRLRADVAIDQAEHCIGVRLKGEWVAVRHTR